MECAICNEDFKTPKLLSCSHVFCELCINEWVIKSKNRDGIECPLCRSITQPTPGASRKSWGTMLPDYMHEDDKDIPHCQPCGFAKESKVAKVFCFECKEYLCNECHCSHSKLKVTKSHRTVNIENVGENKTELYKDYSKLLLCKAHPDKATEFYCQDDNTMFCSTCAFLNHRSCDEVLEIKTNYSEIKSVKPLAILAKEFDCLRVYLKEHLALQQQFDAKFDDDAQELKASLKDVKKKLLKWFEKAEGQINKQMKENNHKNKETNLTLLREFERALQQVDEMDKFTRQLMCIDIDGPEYATVSYSLAENYDEIEDKVKELSLSHEKVTSQKFVFNQKLLDSWTHSASLGTFSEEECDYGGPKVGVLDCKIEGILTLKKQSIRIPRARDKAQYSSATFTQDDPDGKLILTDQANKRLVILYSDEKKDTETVRLKSKPYMAACNKKYLFVTFPNEKMIRKYDLRKDFQGSTEICTRLACYAIGVDSKFDRGNLVVSLLHDDNWELTTYNSDGAEVGTLNGVEGEGNFQSIWHFKVMGNNVYVSNQIDNQVDAYNLEGDTIEHLFSYSHDELKCPGGLDEDFDGDIYVCGMASQNIHVFNCNSDTVHVFKLTELEIPTMIAFSDNGEDVAVLGDGKSPGPLLYKLT